MKSPHPHSTKKDARIPSQSENRVPAVIIDVLTSLFIMSLLGEIYGGSRINEEGNISINLEGISAMIWMCANLFIWPISEGLCGQTLGKRILKTKVISENGDPINMKQAFIRFSFLLIDVTPIGLIASAFLNKRIGDWVAKTRVIDL